MKKIIACLVLLIFIIIVIQPIPIYYNRTYNGIDISHHNKMCWDCISKDSNIRFCYIKATEGKNFKDPKCIEYAKQANALNLEVGLYHYFSTGSTAEEQFKNFKSVAKQAQSSLIPVIDLEDSGNSFNNNSKKELQKLIYLLHKEYGTNPIIYISGSEALKHNWDIIYKCPLWNHSIIFSTKIKRIKIDTINHNYLDLNYANINKLKHKKK